MVNEDVNFRFNVNDGLTIVGHSFVRRVSIRSTVEKVEIFHTLGRSKLDITSWRIFLQLNVLASLIASLALRQAVADFGSPMWSHPRFRSLTGFRFSNVSSSCRDEDVIEARNSKR